MTSIDIDIKAGQVVELRPAEHDGEFLLGIFVDRQLRDVVPFATEAERDRAMADLRAMLLSDQRSTTVPATGLQ